LSGSRITREVQNNKEKGGKGESSTGSWGGRGDRSGVTWVSLVRLWEVEHKGLGEKRGRTREEKGQKTWAKLQICDK